MEAGLTTIFVTVAGAHFLALLSPGPDFVLITKSALKNGKRTAIGVAAGIAIANAFYIMLCLIGVGALIAQSIFLIVIMKFAGGMFLIYLAYSALKSKRSDYKALSKLEGSGSVSASFTREFCTGFVSGILNPKNPLFYLSLFTLVLNNDVSLEFEVFLGVWMTIVVFTWDTLIIFVLSQDKIQAIFSRVAFFIDKFVGFLLGAFGVRLVYSSLFEKP